MSFWSSRRRRAGALAVTLSMAVPYGLPAAFAGEPNAGDKTTAREAYLAGLELREKKDHKGALEKFKVAFALVPSPITALEVGRSLVDLGLLVEGSERLIEAATMPAKPTESAEGKKARVEAKRLADETAARIPSLQIRLDGDVTDVVVSVDGRTIPKDALAAPLKLNPGMHQVSVRRARGEAKVETITLKERELRELSVSAPVPSVTAPPTGPAPTPGPEAGLARDGDPERAPPRVEDRTGTSTWTYVGFGVAGVGLVVGAVTGIAALSKSSTLDGACSPSRACPPAAWGDVDTYNALRVTSFTSFAIAGIGVGIGVAGLLSGGPKEAPKTGVSVNPWIGLGSVGLRGAF